MPFPRVVLHVAVFVAAYLVVNLDWDVALGLNPTVDVLRWTVDAAAATPNAVWIVYRLGGRHAQRPGGRCLNCTRTPPDSEHRQRYAQLWVSR